MQSSVPLFDALADEYEQHFAAPHRRAYDDLAWDLIEPLVPAAGGIVVDAGCGVGRWAERFAARGLRVIGIEHAPRMAQRARARLPRESCTVLETSMDDAEVAAGSADLIVAMGSLQYTPDPPRAVRRLSGWLRAGGWIAVLVDSRIAMAVEKIRAWKVDEGLRELRSGCGTWMQGGHTADVHLLDRASLETALRDARLVEVRSAGLLVTASIFGQPWLLDRLEHAHEETMDLERRLMAQAELADLGKQLLVVGRRPE